MAPSMLIRGLKFRVNEIIRYFKIMFYLNNIYLQFTEALDAQRQTGLSFCLQFSGGQLIIYLGFFKK